MYNYNKKELLNFLATLVNINSYTLNRKGVNAVLSLIRKYFRTFKLQFETYSNTNYGDLLIARTPFSNKKHTILLSVHVDTVFPPSKQKDFKLEGNKAYGSGIIDMKCSIVILYALLNLLKQRNLLENIIITFIPDEERGSQTYKKKLYEIYKKIDYALVFESSHHDIHNIKKRHIVIERKGISIWKLLVKGVSGHSGVLTKKHERHSAIHEIAYKIVQLDKLQNFRKGTTINVGTIRGGLAPNVIAPEVEAEFDIRFKHISEYKRVLKQIQKLQDYANINGTTTELIEKLMIPPMSLNKKTKKLLNIAEEVANESGVIIFLEKRGGGSDANHISYNNVGVLDGLGCIGSKGHIPDEYVYVPSIWLTIDYATALLVKLLQN